MLDVPKSWTSQSWMSENMDVRKSECLERWISEKMDFQKADCPEKLNFQKAGCPKAPRQKAWCLSVCENPQNSCSEIQEEKIRAILFMLFIQLSDSAAVLFQEVTVQNSVRLDTAHLCNLALRHGTGVTYTYRELILPFLCYTQINTDTPTTTQIVI